MTDRQSMPGWQMRLADRLQARLSGSGPVPGSLNAAPDLPLSQGAPRRGQAILSGQMSLAGREVASKNRNIWRFAAPDLAFEVARQQFGWLDDLAAADNEAARDLARLWVRQWISAYGKGARPAWTAALAGPRLIRLLAHADWLLSGSDPVPERRLLAVMGRHAKFLARRWRTAPQGLPRFQALIAGLLGGLRLEGFDGAAASLQSELEPLCRDDIDAEGGLRSRVPADVARLFGLLVYTAEALRLSGGSPWAQHQEALVRMAPALRAFRHGDGSLARFHGGCAGDAAAMDAALAACGVRPGPSVAQIAGYVRLARGRTSLIMDAAAPPAETPLTAHASTLAFEITSARRPLVVNCGAGAGFGADWRQAARATPSHSVLTVDGVSSSRMDAGTGVALPLRDGPTDVQSDVEADRPEARVVAAHNGYVKTHGLIHVRRLDLSADGRVLLGEDVLTAITGQEKATFDTARSRAGGLPFSVRFHLHPSVEAHLDMSGRAVSLTLPSGEIWVFRHSGPATIRLDPSIYLEKTRPEPRATLQIVLAHRAAEASTSVTWSFSKAPDTPDYLRDQQIAATESPWK